MRNSLIKKINSDNTKIVAYNVANPTKIEFLHSSIIMDRGSGPAPATPRGLIESSNVNFVTVLKNTNIELKSNDNTNEFVFENFQPYTLNILSNIPSGVGTTLPRDIAPASPSDPNYIKIVDEPNLISYQ